MEKYSLPQMITIAEAANESNMTYCAIRQLCLENKIHYIRVGTSTQGKYLINKKSLYDYLNGKHSVKNLSLFKRKKIKKKLTKKHSSFSNGS